MDPDAALAALRSSLEELDQLADRPEHTDHPLALAAAQVVDQFQALDRWMGRGGYLPADWRRYR